MYFDSLDDSLAHIHINIYIFNWPYFNLKYAIIYVCKINYFTQLSYSF